jgi:hypothetical protein
MHTNETVSGPTWVRHLWTGIAVAVLLVVVVIIAGCAKNERELPVTELPAKPASATLPCEVLTDAEIIACLKGDDTREICRKLDTTCARYKNLQSFVNRTWRARDGK